MPHHRNAAAERQEPERRSEEDAKHEGHGFPVAAQLAAKAEAGEDRDEGEDGHRVGQGQAQPDRESAQRRPDVALDFAGTRLGREALERDDQHDGAADKAEGGLMPRQPVGHRLDAEGGDGAEQASATAAPRPVANPMTTPPSRVRRMQSSPIGPTGAAMTMPSRIPRTRTARYSTPNSPNHPDAETSGKRGGVCPSRPPTEMEDRMVRR